MVNMLFSSGSFMVLLYCLFLSWHSRWLTPSSVSPDHITADELSLLVQADSKHNIFRSPNDLVAFLAEPGQYSRPFHLLLVLRLQAAAHYDGKDGIRHILSRSDVFFSLAKCLLPSLLSEAAAYPMFVGDLAPYTLIQLSQQQWKHGRVDEKIAIADNIKNNIDDDHTDSSRSNDLEFGYNSVVLVRYRSRRDFVSWLLRLHEDLEKKQLELEHPLRAYTSLFAYDQNNGGDSLVAAAVPLSSESSAFLEGLITMFLVPMVLFLTHLLLNCFYTKCSSIYYRVYTRQ